QADVTAAITSGNWSQLFAGADILNAVPLRYTVHALTGTRPTASIGDTTSYTVSTCDPMSGWYQVSGPSGVVYTDVATNPSQKPVCAMGSAGGATHPYILDEASGQFQALPTDPLTTTSGITVDDAGSVYIQHVNELWQMPPGGGFQTAGKAQQWYI